MRRSRSLARTMRVLCMTLAVGTLTLADSASAHDRREVSAVSLLNGQTGDLTRLRGTGLLKTFESWHRGGRPDQVVGYSSLSKRFNTYRVDDTGRMIHLRSTRTPRRWTSIIEGNFGGNATGVDLAAYDRSSGDVQTYRISKKGPLVAMQTFKVGSNCRLLIPIDIPTSAQDGLLCYDNVLGSATLYRRWPSRYFAIRTWSAGTFATTWDQAVTGDFDGDGQQDFALFDQATGRVTIMRLNGAGNAFDRIDTMITGSGQSTYTQLVAADFDGNGRTDLWLGGTACDPGNPCRGIARLWRNFPAQPGPSLIARWVSHNGPIDPSWSHAVAVDPGNRGVLGLFLYSHRVEVAVRPIVVRTSDGTDAGYTPALFRSIIDESNEAFSAAGIHFTWDGHFAFITDKWLFHWIGNITNAFYPDGMPEALREAYKEALDAFNDTWSVDSCRACLSQKTPACAANWRYSCSDVPVACEAACQGPSTVDGRRGAVTLVLHGTGRGSSSRHVRHVYLGAPKNPVTAWNTADFFAHEVGHYFGLSHAHKDASTTLEMGFDDLDLYTLDPDDAVREDGRPQVLDTPWKPHGDMIAGPNRCDSDAQFNIWVGTLDCGEVAADETWREKQCTNSACGGCVFATEPNCMDGWTQPCVDIVNNACSDACFEQPLPPITPDRHEPMGYGYSCNEKTRYTPDQVRVMRHVLYRERPWLIR